MQLIGLFKRNFSPSIRHIRAESKKLNTKKATVEAVKLSSEQQAVYDLLEGTHDNTYVTGKAGTGKSLVLQYFVAHTKKAIVVLAPTGIAALNIGGVTIHSFFKFSLNSIDPKKIHVDYKTRELLRSVDAIVIDEASMVSADLMEGINAKLQLARHSNEPFGGVQIILFGDLYQLPPVVSDRQVYRHLKDTYGGIYFFNALAFREAGLKVYELNKIFRQKSPTFRALLNAIRQGENSNTILNKVNERANTTPPGDGFVILAGTNATVSAINHNKLAGLPDKEHTYLAEIQGEITTSSFPTEKELRLKVGAQIMTLRNDQEKPMRWANGTLGLVTKLSDNAVHISINGTVYTIIRSTWEKVSYTYDQEKHELKKEITGTFTQFPLRLAWAITIHKSQGRTYESVAIDLGDGAFAHGQTYVALSRCTSLDRLYLMSKVRPEDVIVDHAIVQFMKRATTL